LFCFLELLVSVGESVQIGVSYGGQSKDRNREARLFGSWDRIEQDEGVFVKSPPQSSFRFQSSELPGPFWVRVEKPEIRVLGFVLTRFQITLQEMLARTIKLGLRALVTAASGHASQSQKKQSEL